MPSKTKKHLAEQFEFALFKSKVVGDIVETANDIDAYLACDSVPLECYRKDIDAKLMALKDRVKALKPE